MKELILQTKTATSNIYIGWDALNERLPLLEGRQLFVITDSNVFAYYRYDMWSTLGDYVPIYVLPAGEGSKSLRYVTEIIKTMVSHGIGKRGCVVAIGGGVVGDIAGLVASIYMRGLSLIQIPTSLLAMVDSSVGGKTGIDFEGLKNLIGTFYQPEEIIICPEYLKTLPEREIRCGMGEIIKYGALNKEIFAYLQQNSEKISAPDKEFYDYIIEACVKHKIDVVSKDECEKLGLRKSLNLGHTTGHAFELTYGRKTHGEFVLIGMYYELYIARCYDLCPTEYCNALAELIKKVVKNIPAYEDAEVAAKKARFDKKNNDASVLLILPSAEGEYVEFKVKLYNYVKLIGDCRDWIRSKKGK